MEGLEGEAGMLGANKAGVEARQRHGEGGGDGPEQASQLLLLPGLVPDQQDSIPLPSHPRPWPA